MTKKASLHKLSKRRLVEMQGVEPSKTADAVLKWQPRAVKVRVIRQACVPFGVNSREVSVIRPEQQRRVGSQLDAQSGSCSIG